MSHAHILVFLNPDCRYQNGQDIGRIISSEILDKDKDPKLYHNAMTFMIHGPCGVQNRKSPCMQSERCTKFYPKKFWKILLLMRMAIQYIEGEIMEGLPEKGKKNINNRFVVSYNRYLLLRYNAHINVKWCNQSRSIKYLFKYVNISHNQITTNFYHGAVDSNDLECVDKIKLYYNCRYLSSCKAC